MCLHIITNQGVLTQTPSPSELTFALQFACKAPQIASTCPAASSHTNDVGAALDTAVCTNTRQTARRCCVSVRRIETQSIRRAMMMPTCRADAMQTTKSKLEKLFLIVALLAEGTAAAD